MSADRCSEKTPPITPKQTSPAASRWPRGDQHVARPRKGRPQHLAQPRGNRQHRGRPTCRCRGNLSKQYTDLHQHSAIPTTMLLVWTRLTCGGDSFKCRFLAILLDRASVRSCGLTLCDTVGFCDRVCRVGGVLGGLACI
jgi:hypothetical protein